MLINGKYVDQDGNEFKIFADNDGGLWYYDAEGKAVTIYD